MKKIPLGCLIGILFVAGPAQAARYGLFVGLSQYNTTYISSDNWLDYCDDDAGAMRTNFIAKGGGWAASNTTLLVNSDGTKAATRAALTNYAAKAVSGDVVVFFQSSHGGNDDLTQADVYLCSYNADYTEDELAADLSKFKAGVKVIVIVDACHSGGLFFETLGLKGKKAPRPPVRDWNLAERVADRMKAIRAARLAADPKGAAKLIAPEEVGWMTACAYDLYSYEDDSIAHGWFTYRLLQGFDYGDTTGDGWATFQELFDFAYARIPYDDQVPQDSNAAILATVAGTAGSAPPGDAWDYTDNVVEGATSIGPAVRDFQTTAVHTFRKDLDESDFLAIPVMKNRCYTFRSTNSTCDVDAYLYTYSPSDDQRLIRRAYDIAYPANLEFEMVYKAAASGTVYLRVRPFFGTGSTGSYAVAYANVGDADSIASLSNGLPVFIASLEAGTDEMYRLPIPAGQTDLAIRLSGGTGDADLYVSRGYLPIYNQDYLSVESGNAEAIDVVGPPAGEWFIQVYGYETSYDLTLQATYSPGAATIGAASNAASQAAFAIDLTNNARVSIYSATNFLPTGHWNWAVRSNAAKVVNGQVFLELNPAAAGQIISVGRPLDF